MSAWRVPTNADATADMDLLGMAIFARVVEAKSFSGAARRLNISKSVVSKHVTQIERSLGVRLLNRTTRSISLTEVGAEFYARCSRIVAAAEEAEAVAAHMHSEPRGTLKVNSPVVFGVMHVTPLLRHFMVSCPELRIDMTLSDRTVDLADEAYDAAVTIEKDPNPALVARRLAPIRTLICASPDYFRLHGLPKRPADLARHNCLVCTSFGVEKKWRFGGSDGEAWVEMGGNLCLNNENAIRRAALDGLGIAMLPTYVIGADLRQGTLRAALTDYTLPEKSLYATYLPNRHLAVKVRRFVDFLVARFGATPSWDVFDGSVVDRERSCSRTSTTAANGSGQTGITEARDLIDGYSL